MWSTSLICFKLNVLVSCKSFMKYPGSIYYWLHTCLTFNVWLSVYRIFKCAGGLSNNNKITFSSCCLISIFSWAMLLCPNNLNTGEEDINICQCLSCVLSYTFFLTECWTATSSENTQSNPFSSVKQKHKMSICYRKRSNIKLMHQLISHVCFCTLLFV